MNAEQTATAAKTRSDFRHAFNDMNMRRQSLRKLVQYGERKPLVSTQVERCVFVPEGRRILAGGGTTGTASDQFPSPGGATDQIWSVAPPGLERLPDCFRRFHHRLISAVPPAQRLV